jgi:histidine ammonia-lyase
MQEDHVSMGWSGARKLRRALDGLGRVLAIEIMTGARALDLRGLPPAPGTAAVRDALRAAGLPGPGPDRYLAPEIALAVSAVTSGRVREAAEQAVGSLA